MAEKEKTAAEKERESIEVTTSKKTDVEDNEKKEDEIIEKKEDDVDKEKEEKEDEIIGSKEKEEALEKEKSEAKTQEEKDRVQRRIDREVGKRKAAETRITELEALLAAKPDSEKVLTEEDVETRANVKALQLKAQEDFIRDCNKLARDANKIDPKFKVKVDAMAEDIGPIPSQMIGILADLDNGGAVLNYLTDNVDEAEKIYGLGSAKMALELSKVSTKIDKKPNTPISKVPPPNEPVKGQGSNPEVLRDNEPMDDWVRKRNAQVEERRKAKLAGMR